MISTNYNRRYTKTFIENTWYRRPQGGGPGSWQKLPESETREVPLDRQIQEWVDSTGNSIIHPGQVGIHHQWYDKEMTLKSVTLGLTVLYVKGNKQDAEQPTTTAGAAIEPYPAITREDHEGGTPGSGAGAAADTAAGIAAAYREPSPASDGTVRYVGGKRAEASRVLARTGPSPTTESGGAGAAVPRQNTTVEPVPASESPIGPLPVPPAGDGHADAGSPEPTPASGQPISDEGPEVPPGGSA